MSRRMRCRLSRGVMLVSPLSMVPSHDPRPLALHLRPLRGKNEDAFSLLRLRPRPSVRPPRRGAARAVPVAMAHRCEDFLRTEAARHWLPSAPLFCSLLRPSVQVVVLFVFVHYPPAVNSRGVFKSVKSRLLLVSQKLTPIQTEFLAFLPRNVDCDRDRNIMNSYCILRGDILVFSRHCPCPCVHRRAHRVVR